jgi:oxygen-independent coproporphyrinogen-3 oxidase
VLRAEVDHVSAYSLIVEDGTAMARKVAKGLLPMPDEDVLADRYEIIDGTLVANGFDWYEVSNWSKGTDSACRHNLGYWQGGDWWGLGPGAHSHVGGVRWWNVKHPAKYTALLAEGTSPGAGRETLTTAERAFEQVMLELRLKTGLPVSSLSPQGRQEATKATTEGLLDPTALANDRCVLTFLGRLLADGLATRLLS